MRNQIGGAHRQLPRSAARLLRRLGPARARRWIGTGCANTAL